MKYLATIKKGYNSSAMSFPTLKQAEQWLDENYKDPESTMYIEEFNDDWEKINGFAYTQNK